VSALRTVCTFGDSLWFIRFVLELDVFDQFLDLAAGNFAPNSLNCPNGVSVLQSVIDVELNFGLACGFWISFSRQFLLDVVGQIQVKIWVRTKGQCLDVVIDLNAIDDAFRTRAE